MGDSHPVSSHHLCPARLRYTEEAAIGVGDEILATGLARDVAARGKRAAFGDGQQIIWGPHSTEAFHNNPHIARPGDEGASDIEWVHHYKGHRLYNSLDRVGNRWVWNYDFHPVPGQLFFTDEEQKHADEHRGGFILIEPNVEWQKSVAPNKDWGLDKWQRLATKLVADGHDVAQFDYGKFKLKGPRKIAKCSFRKAMAIVAKAKLVVCPEGGLHHGAAAVGAPAVVIFGGFIPPTVTGYDMHVNLAGGGMLACGSIVACLHCRRAMDDISVEDVYRAATQSLTLKAA